ncbi:hypothetical protein RIF29_31112 [Crotalaria pallida]|uniref:non-specific serine/threonine protein kinase n=1 Tax=Crotalaria pallida TaxID=3830 RepID=A0AAN9EGV6_CROPI
MTVLFLANLLLLFFSQISSSTDIINQFHSLPDNGSTLDLYVRVAASEIDAKEGHSKKKVAVLVPLLLLLVLAFVFTYIYMRKRKLRGNTLDKRKDERHDEEDLELPLFDLATIICATRDFSCEKRLGQGGFGTVYKGTLPDGQEIAVKRLSHNSGQGTKEFKNEVILCAKLQHRNLVKVLGCCIQGEEKLLVYEYMPNKSLDSFLFDSSQSELLDWSKRINIVFGIARGLLYLHHDSRLRIIHRDLKASNILLDSELNPKISDFGMARMFSGNETEGNTRIVVGTYGYMAPEYAINGLFSIKSDVFSFGVLLLEIVSGKKNRGAFSPDQGYNLLGHAWRLWKEDTPMKLIDACLHDNFTSSEFQGDGQDLYIRMDASELEDQDAHKKVLAIIVATTIATIIGMLFLACYLIYIVRRNINQNSEITEEDQHRGDREDDLDLPLLDHSTIVTATDNFSIENKIGKGGFGPVYKGRLASGKEIAVKRLSNSSGQGMTEFKNEVKLIAKLQHRNLVKLLGCCLQGEDRMLVYEYMPNRSLDWLIFDDTKSKLLDWPKRFNIINGIARGLLYLHQDSRLRIIHRDLKASNVLLDEKLNPKISDFGIARIFGGDQTEGNTKRVVGTYGYMAPEYAVDGLFSVKSDVFSFGILLLEIICGKRNRGFYLDDHYPNFVTHAWSLWKDGRASELIDSKIEDSCVLSEVLRCIHVSLLCVQQYPEDRPAMPHVVLMLGSETELADPKEPGFYVKKDSVAANYNSSRSEMITNEMTITLLEAR